MCDRDKAINGLESTMEFLSATKNMFKIGFPNIVSDVYDKALDSISDALALLKAQEPRVMSLEEVINSDSPVYIEGGAAGGTWAMMPKVLETVIEFVANGVHTLYPAFITNEYGKTWRCWTSRPTDAQREAVKWDG